MKKWVLAFPAFFLLLSFCSHPTKVVGGTTTTDNAKVTGSVYYADGSPAKGAAVRVRQKNYARLPGAEPDSVVRHDTTVNDSGRFIVDSLNKGEYRIEVNDLKAAALMLRCSVATLQDSIVLPSDTMRPYTAIAGKVDSSELKTTLFVQLDGTNRLVRVDSATGEFSIADLPPAIYMVRIVSVDTNIKPVVVDSVKTDTGVTRISIAGGTASVSRSPVIGAWTPAAGTLPGKITCMKSFVGTVFIGTDDGEVFEGENMVETMYWRSLGFRKYGRPVQSLAPTFTTDDLFAGIPDGLFRHSWIGGKLWTAILPQTGSTANVEVRAVATRHDSAFVFAGTGGNGMYASRDNGGSWTHIGQADGLADSTVYSLAMSQDVDSDIVVFAGTSGRGVFRSLDSGKTWSRMATGLPDAPTQCIALPAGGKRVYVGNSEGVFGSVDNGTTWKRLLAQQSGAGVFPSISIVAMDPSGAIGDSTVWAAINSKGVFRSTDGGAAWSPVTSGLPGMGVRFLTLEMVTLYVSMENGEIFGSSSWGDNWTSKTNNLYTVDCPSIISNGPDLFARTTGGIYRSTDNGAGWVDANAGLPDRQATALVAGSGGTGTNAFFAACQGRVYVSTDNCATWNLHTTLDAQYSVNFMAAIGSTLFASFYSMVSSNYGILKSTDNGATWVRRGTEISLDNDIQCMTGAQGDAGLSIFLGMGGKGVFRSTDNGENWQAVNNGLSSDSALQVWALTAQSLGAGGTTILAGTYGGIYRSTDNGARWATSNGGLPAGKYVRSLFTHTDNSGGHVFFAGIGGVDSVEVIDGRETFKCVFYSVDDGISWLPVLPGVPSSSAISFMEKGGYLLIGTQNYGILRATIQ